MASQTDPIIQIQRLVRARLYRVRSHAVRHMIEEGFDEYQLLQALTGKLQLVEAYGQDSRYLVLGYFHFTTKVLSPLHILCDLSNAGVVDLVTAYIPQRPWWIKPTLRGKRR
ncbi:MAG: DUF4258 domain-containing protein [Deltaproteobacteria bacterium]|nr:DUF4258 domain-containing protein [Deltaproteobacteria bacterium]